MPTQIAEAYVQIKPSMKGVKNSLKSQMSGEAESAGSSAGESLGNSLVGKLKGIVAAAGIGTIVKSALEAGGDLQQSFGGLDTLYGEASQAAKDYAKEAAKAGISMNDYAEQAVSFGAGLKQAFGGDTTKAVEAANTAILDMADNAAKMGTPLESIQNAYQGFAKGNYTMLDNLKLGFGGTKTEMERLLAKANEINAEQGKITDYSIDNLGDVYEAIHVVQKDLGLTGVAADEAATTFTGSMGAMKAAATNLMASITSGNIDNIGPYLTQLISSTETFLFKNLMPMIGRLISYLPQVISTVFTNIGTLLSNAASKTGSFLPVATKFIAEFRTSIVKSLPALIKGFVSFFKSIGKSLVEFDWVEYVQNSIKNMSDSFNGLIKELGLGDSFTEAFNTLISETLPQLIEKGSEVVNGLLQGIGEALPMVATKLGEIIPQINSFLAANLPKIFTAIGNLIRTAITHLPDILMGIGDIVITILSSLPGLVITLLESLFSLINATTGGFFTNIIESVKAFLDQPLYYVGLALGTIIGKIAQFYADMVVKLVEFFTVTIPQKWNDFKHWLSSRPEEIRKTFDNLPEKLKQIGKDAIAGLWNGIKERWIQMKDDFLSLIKGLVDGIKAAFQIGSPSKLMEKEVGRWIPAGVAVGIESNLGTVQNAMDELGNSISGFNVNNLDYGVTTARMNTQSDNGLAELARAIQNNKTNVTVTLEGDTKKFFRAMQSESYNYRSLTGTPAFY